MRTNQNLRVTIIRADAPSAPFIPVPTEKQLNNWLANQRKKLSGKFGATVGDVDDLAAIHSPETIEDDDTPFIIKEPTYFDEESQNMKYQIHITTRRLASLGGNDQNDSSEFHL